MKKIQCTGCGQVFWTDLTLDEAMVSSGEWVQNPCPKCGAKWAVVEPQAATGARRGRRAKPGPKRGRRPRRTVQAKAERTPAEGKEGAPGFSAAGIRKLRKKLGVSQKKLASLVGVSTGTIVGWEAGKFKPRGSKMAELSDLEKWDKADAEKLMQAKETKQAAPEKTEEKPAETSETQKVEEPKAVKGRARRRVKNKGNRRGKGKKS